MTTILNALLCFFGVHQWHYHRTLNSDEQRRICQVLNCPAYQRLVEGWYDRDGEFASDTWEDIR